MTRISQLPLHELLSHLPAAEQYRAQQNPDTLHRAVMRLFGPIDRAGTSGARAGGGILFRVEAEAAPPIVLIRSAAPPVLTTSSQRTGLELPAPAAGTAVSFRVAVNAVRRPRRSATTGRAKQTVKPVPADEIPEFVMAQLQAALTGMTVISHSRRVIGAGTGAGRSAVQIDMVDGFAIVGDTAVLEQILNHGVGRAKNFGCGMLTVRAL